MHMVCSQPTNIVHHWKCFIDFCALQASQYKSMHGLVRKVMLRMEGKAIPYYSRFTTHFFSPGLDHLALCKQRIQM